MAFMNFIHIIEYSGRYAIRKVEVVTRYERRRIPHSCVNSFRIYNFFVANQYLILCC